MSRETVARREFLAGAAADRATIALSGDVAAAADGKKTVTILHTNDMHSDCKEAGIAQRPGPVLALDAGDYSVGTRSTPPLARSAASCGSCPGVEVA
jgi:2',3'-cyclic-nucleotide 2'-phosphodiesterase (5'-nucleotidase family)